MANKTANTDFIAARLPLALADQLRAHAADYGCTMTEVIIMALRKFFAQEGGSEA